MSSTSQSQTCNTSDDQGMEARYWRAEYLEQGPFTKNVAFNTTVYPTWIEGRDCFWYQRDTKEGKQYRLVDATASSNVEAFDHQALAVALSVVTGETVDAIDLPIDQLTVTLSPLQLRFTAFGRWWLFDSKANTCKEVPGYASDLLISPDGTKAAFVRDFNLWLLDIATGEERPLTHDGMRNYSYAEAPAAYGQKVTVGTVEALWSPDSKRLFTLQLDTRQVRSFPIIEHLPADGSLRPVVTSRPIALPGDEHMESYRFLTINVETGDQQNAHYRQCDIFYNAMGFFSCDHAWWGSDSRYTYFIDMERGNQTVRLVEFDTHSGACREVIKESSDICIRLCQSLEEPPVMAPLDSNEVLWYSERSGWAHLYLYDLKTGELKQTVTQGEWLVRRVLHVDTAQRELWIQTAERVDDRNAYYQDICRVNIDTGEITPVVSTDDEYVVIDPKGMMCWIRDLVGGDVGNSTGVSPSGRFVVTTRSRVDSVPVSLLLDRDGNELLIVETADVSGLPDNWQWPEPVKCKAADGETDLYGVIYRPSDFSAEKTYPVLDISYVGPEGQFMPVGSFSNSFFQDSIYYHPAAYAELGFIVVTIAGRGTSMRNKAFLNDKGSYLPDSKNQADRISGIKQLAARYPYMDLNRVGIGESQTTATPICGMLGHPEFYKVGVSHNALMDMRLFASFYADEMMLERYRSDEGAPRKHMHEYAENLRGKLLLMQGMLDPQTHVAVTFRLIESLKDANKRFDMLLLPNDGHILGSYAILRAWDYFVEHLLGEEPPKDFVLTTSTDIMMSEAYAKQTEGVLEAGSEKV